MTEDEVWKEIPDLPGYLASSMGRIRRKGRPIRKPVINRKGYVVLGVTGKQFRAHRLICRTFHGPAPEGCEVGHLNGNRTDNRAENLKWVTPKENQAHRAIHGTELKGTKQPSANFTRAQLEDILERVVRRSETIASVARSYGVSRPSISLFMNGITYCSELGLKP